jgi:hypothetical protein
MSQHPNMTDMNRRDFLGSAAGLTLSLTLAPLALTGEAGRRPRSPERLSTRPTAPSPSCRRQPRWGRARSPRCR